MPSEPKSKKDFAIELFCRILRRSGICYLLRKCLWRNQAALLVYHDPKPAVIDAHLSYLRRVAKVVPVPDLWSSFYNGPLAAITIDDGAIGNLELQQVFEKHNVIPFPDQNDFRMYGNDVMDFTSVGSCSM